MGWGGAHTWNGTMSRITTESTLWQFYLSSSLADRGKRSCLSPRKKKKWRHLPSLSHTQMTRTGSMADNFLFLRLISTFIPPGSSSRAITQSLQLFCSVPEQWPQWQQMGSNTVMSSHAIDLKGQTIPHDQLFISRISQKNSWSPGSVCHMHILSR